MLSGGPLPQPRQQLHNTIANLSHITAVLPTAAPCAQIFGADLIHALQVFRSLDDNWDGLTAAAGRDDGDGGDEAEDMSKWFRIQPSYRSGKHQLARLFVQVQRIIHQLVAMANEDPHGDATMLHLKFEVLMGLFVAVFEGMRALEKDFEPRHFDVVDPAITFVDDMDRLEVEADLAEPAEGRDIQSLTESVDHGTGDLGTARPSLIDIQRAALWRWRKQTGTSGVPKPSSGNERTYSNWKPIVLPPEIKITPPEPMVFQPAHREQVKPKVRGLKTQERLYGAAGWGLICPLFVWIFAVFATFRPFGTQYYKTDFAMKIAFCVQFFELPLLGLGVWLTLQKPIPNWRRVAAIGISFAIGLEAVALAAWSLYLQTHDNRGEIPFCNKRSGRKFFFDDCGRHSHRASEVSLYIFDGCRLLMIVGPIVASVIYIGGGSLTRTLTKSRGYQEVSSGPTDAV